MYQKGGSFDIDVVCFLICSFGAGLMYTLCYISFLLFLLSHSPTSRASLLG